MYLEVKYFHSFHWVLDLNLILIACSDSKLPPATDRDYAESLDQV